MKLHSNLPKKAKTVVSLAKFLKNWREVAWALGSKTPFDRLQFRNGVVLEGATPDILRALFEEIWIAQAHNPPGYEIQRGDTVVDVGANIGTFTTFAATRAPGVIVFAFEPSKANFEWLRKNIEASGLKNVRAFQQAVAGSSAERPFFVEPTNSMFHSLNTVIGVDGGIRQSELVKCVSLDDLFREHGIECCHLLKLDCEGAEFEILRNCSPETLRRVKKIVGEYHEVGEDNGETWERLLKSLSFRVDHCSAGGFAATNLSA